MWVVGGIGYNFDEHDMNNIEDETAMGERINEDSDVVSLLLMCVHMCLPMFISDYNVQ